MADLQSGWTPFLSKHLQDYLLGDNGAFIEIVRQTASLNSAVIGMVHLDASRCQRTGDPEIPVLYTDRKGRIHELKRYEVIDITDMPDPREIYFGVGHCAASRAYRQITKQASVETYIYEKINGQKIKEVSFVSGINQKQIDNFIRAAEGQASATGLVAYMGAVIVPVPGDKPPEVAKVPLAEFPDGFDRKEEFDIAVLAYADAIGLDPQDLQPLTGQSLGSGAQSQVLSDKASGKGLTSWRQAFMHALNLWVIPDMTTMVFIEHDWRDKKLEAEFNKTTVDYVKAAVGSIITPLQGLQKLVDEHVLPKEFLPIDSTPGTDLSDDEKPDEATPPLTDAQRQQQVLQSRQLEQQQQALLQQQQQVAQPPAKPGTTPTPTKPTKPVKPGMKDHVDDLLEVTADKARALAKKILPDELEEESKPSEKAVTGTPMKIVIRQKGSAPVTKSPSQAALMPLLLASTLLNASYSDSNGLGEDAMSKLTDWIAALRADKPTEKQSSSAEADTVEAQVVEGEDGQMLLTILMPTKYFQRKAASESQPDIVINIPAPVINFSPQMPQPVINLPAPVVQVQPGRAPNVTVVPNITISPPGRTARFEVQRDAYDNVLGIEEKSE